jgi:hypothetical protein
MNRSLTNLAARIAIGVAVAATALAPATSAWAHAEDASAASSALSALPVAVSVVAPIGVISAGTTLVVVSVEAAAIGTVWVLERASDGAKVVLKLSAQGAGAVSVGVGTVVTLTAISTGWVLIAGSEMIAFIPNELGKALLYNERVTY